MILSIVGPTGSGKSDLAVEVALRFGGEVISCDSVQVYRGFDIGSGKITPEEMKGVPHHLLNILEGNERFTVGSFVALAENLVEDILARGRLPIIVGGTGLYYRAFAYRYALTEEYGDNEVIRQRLIKELEEKGVEQLYDQLKDVDEKGAGEIDPRHSSRIIRALVYYYSHKKGIGSQKERTEGLRADLHGFYLDVDRELLYKKINSRVDMMVSKGLVDEVAGLIASGISTEAAPMKTIGYREIICYLNGDYGLEEAIAKIKQSSRNYAKRQITWFRKHPELERVPYNTGEDREKIISCIENILNK